ncbi:MAG: sugar kinase, partial [Candidatus Coatesbacteria bacterium]|nr:sugar kinase [Candidatus Coatesbacteria bacterium]
ALTPNETEIEEVLDIPLQTNETRLIEEGEKLRKQLGLETLLVTRGSKGMMLISESGAEAIPIFGSDEVADVTGAGDTVVAVFTTSLACGASFSDAAHLASIAGGIVVTKRGTATVSADELQEAVATL